ncbi:hypothetical protein [Candidatus Mycobacterium methanotrophicum]|uniref:hypothetical protein n=1 Tax=Candidatus Mycobacterium methanotrophicum TaxID=2943498 RepID=UPI001C56AA69|nr:hypothetical protein [Candidatus Mycobacterium methanotrophicum]
MIAAQADVHERAEWKQWSHVTLDGTLIDIDRVDERNEAGEVPPLSQRLPSQVCCCQPGGRMSQWQRTPV